jgi:hypothetical protein
MSTKRIAGIIFLAIGVLAIIALFFITLDPKSQVRAIAQNKGTHYEELLVVFQNRSYEQLLKSNDDGSIVLHEGTWLPASEMPEGEKMLGKDKVANFVAFNDRLDTGAGKRPGLSLEEYTKLLPPDDEKLALWNEWKAKASQK